MQEIARQQAYLGINKEEEVNPLRELKRRASQYKEDKVFQLKQKIESTKKHIKELYKAFNVTDCIDVKISVSKLAYSYIKDSFYRKEMADSNFLKEMFCSLLNEPVSSSLAMIIIANYTILDENPYIILATISRQLTSLVLQSINSLDNSMQQAAVYCIKATIGKNLSSGQMLWGNKGLFASLRNQLRSPITECSIKEIATIVCCASRGIILYNEAKDIISLLEILLNSPVKFVIYHALLAVFYISNTPTELTDEILDKTREILLSTNANDKMKTVCRRILIKQMRINMV